MNVAAVYSAAKWPSQGSLWLASQVYRNTAKTLKTGN